MVQLQYSEPYTFGFNPKEIATYLAERGFDLARDFAVSQLASRYFSKNSGTKVYAYYHLVEAMKG